MSRRTVTSRILHRHGTPVVIRRTGGGTFDDETSAVTGEKSDEVETSGPIESFVTDEVNGVEIQRDDMKLTVPTMDFDGKFKPRKGDVAIVRPGADDEETLNVERVRVLDGAAFSIQLRGGGPQASA